MNASRWLLLAILSAVCGLAAARLMYGLPKLDRQHLAAAREQWRENGLTDYDVSIQVTGRQAAAYRVEVRDGSAVRAWRNGEPLKQPRTFQTWSVPGMFDTIQRDVDHAAGETPVAGVGQLKLFCRFDPEYGFPRQYLRVENGASNNDVAWRVVEFQDQSNAP